MPKPFEGVRPPANVLYSEYIRARPADPRPPNVPVAVWAAAGMRSGLSDEVRNRLLLALQDCAPSVSAGAFARTGVPTEQGVAAMVSVVARRLARFWGDLGLASAGRAALDAIVGVVLQDNDSRVLDVVGAWLDAYARLPDVPWLQEAESRFAERIDAVLVETQYARRGRDIVLRRDAGTAPVVEQPLRAFMTSRPQLAAVDSKLGEALAELDAGNGADAITDAATALQLLLAELGHAGGTLGEQLASARKTGLFTGVDHQLGEALDALGRWAAAVRNQRGDAHPGPPPDLADAQLMVRLTAVLVMRLGT